MSLRCAPCRPGDRAALAAFLAAHHAVRVARRGELVSALDQPALLAWDGDHLAGAATYVVSGEACELLTLHAADRGTGAGTALVAAVRDEATRAGCTRMWLVTTNDNVDALRFYQRRGFRLDRLRPGAVDAARAALKPEIPTTGEHGIALRDELELVTDLG
jgi:GNAT superfamily N-acetyltransferase